MKSMKFIIFLLLFCCGLGAWADNNITLSSVEGAAGTEVTVSVSMTNTDAVSALQLSIPLDENLTFVQNSQQAGSRISGHAISAGVKDGVLNLMVYSTTMAAISGNYGEVCSFILLLGDTPGTVSLAPSKASLTDTSGNSLIVSTTAGTVETRGAKAEINTSTLSFDKVGINQSIRRSLMIKNVGNEPLTISEVTFTSTIFSTTTSLPMTINVGNTEWIYVNCTPTALSAIDEEMIIVSNNVSGNSTIRLTATPYAVNELTIGSVSGITDEEVTVPILIKNFDAINGLQLDLQIPKDLEYVDGSFTLSDRKQDHLAAASIENDRLIIVAYSPTDKPFNDNDGKIGEFKVKILGSNSVSIWINKAILSATIDGKSVDVLSDKIYGMVSVKSPNMYANNSLDFGRISIKEQDVQKTYTIRNYGSAPLIISNINFANGLFHIQEELPLTIETSSSKTITVVCEAKEEGDVDTNMEIYTNDPNRRLFIAKITGEIFTPDYLTPIVEGKPDEVNLAISLNNYSDIYGIQFDIVTAKEFTASANDVTLTERGNNLSVSINSIAEGKLRVVAYVKNNQFISSGEGKVMTIKLVPKESLTTDAYTMTLSNITLGSKGMKNIYAGKDVAITFGIGDPVTVTAKSYTRKYGEANPTFEYDVEGAELDGQPVITCEAKATSPVGEYPIVIKKGSVKNYNDTYVNGVLTIEKAPLIITAKSYTIKLGEALPTFEAQYSGFKNYEKNNVLTKQPTITCETTSTSTPGTYDIVVSGAEAQNYEISYEKGTLTIIADPVTVTANSYTIAYGDAIPELGYTSKGASLIGTPNISCEATSNSPIGTYPIIISKGTVKNYNDTYENGVLTITKAPLNITAKNYDIKWRDPIPTYEIEYHGFKNGETDVVLKTKPTVSSKATSISMPGTYDIIVSGAEAGNYEISYTNGLLTILPPQKGDVNNDEFIDIADLSCVALFILEDADDTMFFGSADMDDSGIVEVNDYATLVNVILSQDTYNYNNVKTRRSPVVQKPYLDAFFNDEGELLISLTENRQFTGLQFDLLLPDNVFLQEDGISCESNQHGCWVIHRSDGSYRVICGSMTNIELNKGVVLHLRLNTTGDMQGLARINNIVLSDVKARRHEATPIGIYLDSQTFITSNERFNTVVSTSIRTMELTSSRNQTVHVISINGVVMADVKLIQGKKTTIHLPSGIYLVNGKKVTVK